jgi:hypothetical protein
MVVVLGDDDMGQEPYAGPAAGNRVIGCRRRNDGVAGPARHLLADVPDHFEAAGQVIEGLGILLADPVQRAAARGAGTWRGVQRVLARQCLPRRRPGSAAACASRSLPAASKAAPA